MKHRATVCLLLLFFLAPYSSFAQRKQGQARLDSLLAEVPKMREDTNGVKLMNNISFAYCTINPDDGLKWAEKELALAQKLGWQKGEAYAYMDFGNNYQNKAAYPSALEADFKAMRIFETLGDKGRIGAVSTNIGTVYWHQKDYPQALEWYFKALKIAEERGDKGRMYSALGNIGNVYEDQGKSSQALEYKLKALRICEELNNRKGIINQTGNIGITYSDGLKQYNEALVYYFRSLHMAEEMGEKQSIAIQLGNIGVAYYRIAADSTTPKPDSLVPASRSANLAKAVEYLNKGIAASRETKNNEGILEFSQSLSLALALQGDYKGAMATYKQSVALKDSLYNKANDEKLIRSELGYTAQKAQDSIKLEGEKRALRLQQEAQLAALHRDYERRQALAKTDKERQQLQYEEALKGQQISAAFRQKEADADAAHQRAAALAKTEEERKAAVTALALRRQRNLLYASLGAGVLMLLIGGLAFRAYRQRRSANIIIAAEREKSESLLRNILPAEVAAELKAAGHTVARQYDDVSVLFTDFVNFTGIGEGLSPQALVKELHECFSAFDAIIRRNGLEKIKTIGDAYMAVCGLPQSDERHARRTIQAALEIREFIAERKRRERVFEIRIGINSGSVVAGIVGTRKFAYDIWGDTVNLAARMEQHGEAGCINISQATYALVRKDFDCTPRGAIAAKNKGEVEMYFVEPAPAYA